MTIEVKKEGTELTVAVSGRVDTVTAPEFDKTIHDNLEGMNTLVIDLCELSYISSAGLRVLLSNQKIMNQRGGMKVINVNDMVREIFEVTGFDSFLTIE